MNKFGQFLEDEPPKPKQGSQRTQNQLPLNLGDKVSIKVNISTLNRLKLLKTITGQRSYAEVIEELLDSYLDHAGRDLRVKLDLLKS